MFICLDRSCKANEAAYSAIKLGAFFNLDDLVDYRKVSFVMYFSFACHRQTAILCGSAWVTVQWNGLQWPKHEKSVPALHHNTIHAHVFTFFGEWYKMDDAQEKCDLAYWSWWAGESSVLCVMIGSAHSDAKWWTNLWNKICMQRKQHPRILAL